MDGSSPPLSYNPQPTAYSLRDLEDQITELSGHLNAANHRWLTLIAEFDRREGWNGVGVQSCAHWLNWKCGVDLGAAREKVRVARALESLPRISAAMERGELSYSKVRALTRVACEKTEEYLLMIALHGTAYHVETLVRHFRRAKEAEELSRDAQQQANRCLTYHYDDDGSLVLKARLPAEAGAALLKALQHAEQQSPEAIADDVSAETLTVKSTPTARRADALAVIAESFLAHGAEAMTGGDKHQVVLHVAKETLEHREAGCCEFEDGPSIAAETARRLACDASVVTLVEDDEGEPLNVGRKTRSIPPALRRALNARDKGCRFPGCTHTRYVDAHHVHHWADGGETKLSNLVSLCRFHHRKVHEGGMTIEVPNVGALRFVHADGRALSAVVPLNRGDAHQLTLLNAESGIRIDSKIAASRWQGESMDYGLAVEALSRQQATLVNSRFH